MNKKELLVALEEQREAFMDVIENLSEEQLTTPGVAGKWSVKDILSHISRWEAELVTSLWQISQGQKPGTVLFNMKGTVDDVNRAWYEQTAGRELTRVLDDFHAVRNQTILRLEDFSDNDLTNPKRYPYMEGTPLWQYIENNSFGHEAEHLPDIQGWLQQRKSP